MKKVMGVVAMVALFASCGAPSSEHIHTLKTDKGECFVILERNRQLAEDPDDKSFQVPCEISTERNVSEQFEDDK
jgi:hypothetical protein